MLLSKYQTEQHRIASALIDRMLFMPLFLVEQWLCADTSGYTLLVSWLLVTAMLRLLYAAWLHQRYGYTFGKWLVGIRVVDLTETRNLTWTEGLRRESLYFLIEILVIGVFYFTVANSMDSGALYARYRNLTRNVGLLWIFVTVCVMLSNPKRRTLPDFIGRSVVVKS